MIEERKLTVLDANILYLIGAALLLLIGSYVQSRELISGLLITQYGLILLPPVIYLLVKKINVAHALRFKSLRLKHAVLVALITILAYPAALAANAFVMFLLSLAGNLNIPQIPTAENTQQYALLMFVVSFSAGVCEEVLFRGFILRGYEALGTKKAIVISALLFGFFHFNLYNLGGPIVLGLVFGYLVTLTGSIFAGILGHIVNNGFAVTLGFLMNRLISDMNLEEAAEMAAQSGAAPVSTTTSMLVTALLFALIAMGTGVIAMRLVKIIKKDMQAGEVQIQPPSSSLSLETDTLGKFRIHELWPLGIVALIYVFYPVYIQISEIIQLG